MGNPVSRAVPPTCPHFTFAKLKVRPFRTTRCEVAEGSLSPQRLPASRPVSLQVWRLPERPQASPDPAELTCSGNWWQESQLAPTSSPASGSGCAGSGREVPRTQHYILEDSLNSRETVVCLGGAKPCGTLRIAFPERRL